MTIKKDNIYVRTSRLPVDCDNITKCRLYLAEKHGLRDDLYLIHDDNNARLYIKVGAPCYHIGGELWDAIKATKVKAEFVPKEEKRLTARRRYKAEPTGELDLNGKPKYTITADDGSSLTITIGNPCSLLKCRKWVEI